MGRSCIGTMAAVARMIALLLPLAAAFAGAGAAREFRDDAGRAVTVPESVERVFAAGPPAAILLYTLAPEKMLGWPRANSRAEAAFMPQQFADLPELGRLTGRGDTANLEVVLAARPDLLFDYGTIDPTYVSLADAVQRQTRLPYLLIDGRFDRIPDAYRTLTPEALWAVYGVQVEFIGAGDHAVPVIRPRLSG